MEQTQEQKLTTKIKKINELRQNIISYFNYIEETKKEIKELEKFVWKNCKHEWVYLDDGDYYSRIKYKCKHCNLYRNQYMYN